MTKDNANLSIIVVIAENNAIGANGDLLCHLPGDLKHFKTITKGHTVIMGRKTFDSLPKGALPDRKNIVITRNKEFSAPNVIACNSLEEALHISKNDTERFIIGGAQIYGEALPMANKLYLTHIKHEFANADTFFPQINYDEWLEISQTDNVADEKNRYDYSFVTLIRK